MMEFKKIGEDVRVSNLCVITRPHLITLGNHVAIDQFVTITTNAEIGDYVHIAPNCSTKRVQKRSNRRCDF
jgi:acetyltransferase-like isoleucine patch superfamily enzyme